MTDLAAAPPNAPTRSYTRTVHGQSVNDPYHWMADKSDPELLAYLADQNAWAEHCTTHTADLREELYADMSARTQQTDLSVPVHVRHTDGSAFWYYSRTTEGLNYPRTCRVPATTRDQIPDLSQTSPDEVVLLDVNRLAEGHEFTALGLAEVSPNGRLLAYSLDTTGDERYDLSILDLGTGEVIDGPLPGIGSGGTWAGDDHLFYTRVDDAWRPHQVWRHQLGAPADTDALIMEETDARFWMGVDSSRDWQWVQIDLGSKKTSETWLIPAADPETPPRCVAARRPDVEYSVDVGTDALWIVHNHQAPQFALCQAPLDAISAEQWVPVLPEQENRRLLGISVYDTHAVVSHRTDGLPGITVFTRTGANLGDPHELAFNEASYDVRAEDAQDADTDRIRFQYESLTAPPSVWEYRLDTGSRRLLKQVEVLEHPHHGAYDPTAYTSERLWATAADGTEIPISLVRRHDTPVDGTAPGLLYGYGSYEIPIDPYFATSRISLLDRGFVYAIAHVRGGGERGRPWYDAGKELTKRNTFTDFVSCAQHLIAEGYVAVDRLAAEGGSAGGLLIGAATNLAPDLFRAVHADVPFVDPLTTILNPELPLTVMEWEEWGNPVDDPEVYAYIKSYSPYENIQRRSYPAILATTSLYDTRVEVTEPAKWIARLQQTVIPNPARPVLLRTEMAGGHGGASGRYQAWRERAWQLAWLIDQVSTPST
ncbi:MAG: S9 family peptidase [Propioniciclava sp.]